MAKLLLPLVPILSGWIQRDKYLNDNILDSNTYYLYSGPSNVQMPTSIEALSNRQ